MEELCPLPAAKLLSSANYGYTAMDITRPEEGFVVKAELEHQTVLFLDGIRLEPARREGDIGEQAK